MNGSFSLTVLCTCYTFTLYLYLAITSSPFVSLKQSRERHFLSRLQPISLIIFDTLPSLNHMECINQPRFIRRIRRRFVHHTSCTHHISSKRQDICLDSMTHHGSKPKFQEDKPLLSSLPSHPNSPYLVPPQGHRQKSYRHWAHGQIELKFVIIGESLVKRTDQPYISYRHQVAL